MIKKLSIDFQVGKTLFFQKRWSEHNLETIMRLLPSIESPSLPLNWSVSFWVITRKVNVFGCLLIAKRRKELIINGGVQWGGKLLFHSIQGLNISKELYHFVSSGKKVSRNITKFFLSNTISIQRDSLACINILIVFLWLSN